MTRILIDLYFEGVGKLRRALLGTETPTVNSEVGYDDTEKRVRVFDGVSAKKLLQENDISTNTALGTSDTLLPSQKAVKDYVDALITSVGIQPPTAFDASVATTFPTGVKGDSYIVTVAGTVQSVILEVGDWFFAGVEIAAADPNDWIILQRNVDIATTTSAGIIRIATETEALAGLLDTIAITPKDLAAVLATIPPPTNGVDGLDGKSAYQVWLDNGNTGTEQVFLDSLVGADGMDGLNGSNGLDGIDGANGANGVGVPVGGATGQVLSKIDATDYNTQWINESIITETVLATIQTPATTESDKYVSARMFWSGISTLKTTSNTWTDTQTFNIINVKQLYTTKQTFILGGSNPLLDVNLDNGSYILIDLRGVNGILDLSFSNGKVGASYMIHILRNSTLVKVNLVNEGRLDGEVGGLIEALTSLDFMIVPFYTGTGFILNIANLT